MQPKVAFVLPSLNGGGAERATLNLCRHSGLATKLIVERRGGDLASDPAARGAIIMDLPPWAGRAQRVAGLARILRNGRPGVAVAVLSPLTTALAARIAGSRTMLWLQNPPTFMPGIKLGESTPLGRHGLRTLAHLADAIAGTSPGLIHEWAAAGVPPSKLMVLPNGVELSRSAPRVRRPLDPGVPLQLLTIGRLAPQKRHDLLIRALSEIRRQRDAELTILGRGDDESQLRGLADATGVAEHVHFAGFVSDPTSHLASADIFVLASDFEGFGNVIVEALGHGLSVVCTDAPYGPRFIADDCGAIRLVPRGDPAALASQVLALASEPLGERAAEARARARDFSIQRVSALFDTLITRMLRREPLPAWEET